MTAKKPSRKALTVAEFEEHAARMRKLGATRVRVQVDGVEYEAEFLRPRNKRDDEKQPAIGFMSPLAEECDEW